MGKPVAVKNLDALTSWHSDWRGLRVAVLGLGTTGFSVADTLSELGAEVLVVAESASEQRVDLITVIGADYFELQEKEPVPARMTEFSPELLVVSPGFRPAHPLIAWATELGIPIWGDIELAWRLRDKVGSTEWILVTGTNGKTTTVQIAAHLLAAAGKRVATVGNIGIPVVDAVRAPEGFDFLVVELSSFQLHWMPTTGPGAVVPLASVCLNLAADHFDWHGSAGEYRAAKSKVYENTRVACVYNKSDLQTEEMVEAASVAEGCRAIGFGLSAPGQSDFGVVGDIVVDRAFLDDRHIRAIELTTHGELAAAGLAAPHSVENVLAACALVRAAGVPFEIIRDAIATFQLDHHRTELIRVTGDIQWINDSKATNPHAANASLATFESVVWIVGGLLKGIDVNTLVEKNVSRLRAAIIIGADRTELASAFQRHAPELPIFEVDTAETNDVMRSAVQLAVAVAKPGDVVLLAPAAASMDQFSDYAERGQRFAEAVEEQVGGSDDKDGASR